MSELELAFDTIPDIELAAEPIPEPRFSIEDAVIEASADHNRLFNRDLPDQHPIASVTSLRAELDAKSDESDTVPDSFIESL